MRIKTVLFLVAVTIAVSGCPAENSGSSINFSGDINATESHFSLEGEVVNTGYTDAVYQNVSVYLFMANGTVIESVHLGELDGSADVSMNSDKIPKYVIFHSPDFWTDDDIDVSYYEFVRDSQAPDGIYTERSATNETELPVSVRTATG